MVYWKSELEGVAKLASFPQITFPQMNTGTTLQLTNYQHNLNPWFAHVLFVWVPAMKNTAYPKTKGAFSQDPDLYLVIVGY